MINRLFTLFFFFSISTSTYAQDLNIEHLGENNEWTQSKSIYLEKGTSAHLRVNTNQHKSIKWFQIVPDTSQFYKNANFPWEKNAYQWNGFGQIDYKRVELKTLENQSEVLISSDLLKNHQLRNNPFYSSELGSFWFDVEVLLEDGTLIKSPGLELNNKKGLSPDVFRVSYIDGRDYIGYLTSFFNVPGVFGSIPYQSINYIGVDCADVLMATKSIISGKTLKDYNVAMLVSSLNKIASMTIKYGKPNQTVKWGDAIHPGDFIAVRYKNQRQFSHIGALYKDKNNNGELDPADLVIHAGPDALHVSSLYERGFDGEVIILKND